MNKKNQSKTFFVILLIWWCVGLSLAFLQAYFMSQKIFSLLLGSVFIILFAFGITRLHNKLEKKRIRIAFYIIGLLHFIPLVLQFIGNKTDALDNVITALVGLGIIYFASVRGKK